MIENPNDRDIAKILNDLPGGSAASIERFDNTPLDEETALAMMKFIERIINIKDSIICQGIINAFVASKFITNINQYIAS
jgi:hypothetical protein